jgi:hypothetical protein
MRLVPNASRSGLQSSGRCQPKHTPEGEHKTKQRVFAEIRQNGLPGGRRESFVTFYPQNRSMNHMEISARQIDYRELKDPDVKTILSSYDVLGGPSLWVGQLGLPVGSSVGDLLPAFLSESSHSADTGGDHVPVHHLLCASGQHRINYISAADGQREADGDPENQAHAALSDWAPCLLRYRLFFSYRSQEFSARTSVSASVNSR